MNTGYWKNFYAKVPKMGHSTFAEFCLPFIKGSLVDMGCGNGRDLNYFIKNGVHAYGVDQSFKSKVVLCADILDYIKVTQSPNNVYTRFFWHAITRKEQLAIMNWLNGTLFIEARTTEDEKLPKVFKKHKRNFVDVPQLVTDLKERGFQIIRLEEGYFSPFKGENPHLVRLIAKK